METDPASTRSLEFQVLEQVAKPGMEESDDSLMTLSASQVGNLAFEAGHSPGMAVLGTDEQEKAAAGNLGAMRRHPGNPADRLPNEGGCLQQVRSIGQSLSQPGSHIALMPWIQAPAVMGTEETKQTQGFPSTPTLHTIDMGISIPSGTYIGSVEAPTYIYT